MRRMRRAGYWGVTLLVALAAGAALWRQLGPGGQPGLTTLGGRTMGTTYTIKVAGPLQRTPEALHAEIEARLAEINRSMSTWDPASEISVFNAAPAGSPLTLSPDFIRVLEASLRLSKETGGAFDVTVGPLVNLWGFGPTERQSPPDAVEIAAARLRTGYRKLDFDGVRLVKKVAGMYLDFSGIAKGYGVDELAAILRRHGIADFLVQIGGETVVQGRAPGGEGWVIGVERPQEELPPGAAILRELRLSAGALSTSGSYRNSRRTDAGRAHHIIDPHTGAPTDSALVAVTVYAQDAMTADSVATALMVMGVEEGLRWVEARPGVAAMFTEATPSGGFASRLSSGFTRLVK